MVVYEDGGDYKLIPRNKIVVRMVGIAGRSDNDTDIVGYIDPKHNIQIIATKANTWIAMPAIWEITRLILMVVLIAMTNCIRFLPLLHVSRRIERHSFRCSLCS